MTKGKEQNRVAECYQKGESAQLLIAGITNIQRPR